MDRVGGKCRDKISRGIGWTRYIMNAPTILLGICQQGQERKDKLSWSNISNISWSNIKNISLSNTREKKIDSYTLFMRMQVFNARLVQILFCRDKGKVIHHRNWIKEEQNRDLQAILLHWRIKAWFKWWRNARMKMLWNQNSNQDMLFCWERKLNKLAKARKTRKSPATLGLKKFGRGKIWVKKVGPKIFLYRISRRPKIEK